MSDQAAARIAVARSLWDAMRERDVDQAMTLMHDDVEWIPLVTEGGPVHGSEALRHHLEGIAAAGLVADAYALDFEDCGDGRVLISGALRVRRPDHWLATVQRWWVYVIRDGKIRRAEACATRDDALLAAGAG
jgi:hypothetical protein